MRFDPVARVIRAGEAGMFLVEGYREISTRREGRKGKRSSPVLENRVHSFKQKKKKRKKKKKRIIILDGLEINASCWSIVEGISSRILSCFLSDFLSDYPVIPYIRV